MFIKAWPSITVAAKKMNISKSVISKATRGKLKTAAGFIWTKDFLRASSPTIVKSTLTSPDRPKKKKVNALAKAKVLEYVVANWVADSGTDAKNVLKKTRDARREDFKLLEKQVNTPWATMEIATISVAAEVFNELYGNYPDGSIRTAGHKPVKWHKSMAETLVKEGLVKA